MLVKNPEALQDTDKGWHVCLSVKAALLKGKIMSSLQLQTDCQFQNDEILGHFLGYGYVHYFKFQKQSDSLLILFDRLFLNFITQVYIQKQVNCTSLKKNFLTN